MAVFTVRRPRGITENVRPVNLAANRRRSQHCQRLLHEDEGLLSKVWRNLNDIPDPEILKKIQEVEKECLEIYQWLEQNVTDANSEPLYTQIANAVTKISQEASSKISNQGFSFFKSQKAREIFLEAQTKVLDILRNVKSTIELANVNKDDISKIEIF